MTAVSTVEGEANSGPSVREEESSDSTGPIFIPRCRGAARRRSRRRAGLPTTSPTRGTASWIQISDYRPTSDEDGLTSHNACGPAPTPPLIRASSTD